MKNRFILIFALLCSMPSMATVSLVVKPLSGKECITALEEIGKIVYSGDSIYVYDTAKDLVFSDLLLNIQHVRFSNEQSSTPTHVENLQDDHATQILVYPNPTQDILLVKNAKVDVVRLYTLTGNLMQTVTVLDREAQLNVSTYPIGSYLLLCGNKAFQIIKH
jgi:hypothetical protein